MSKAASHSKLSALHSKFADYLIHILDEATAPPMANEDGELEHLSIPLDAATMGCISRFLKDNEITCEPVEADNLDELREKYSRQSRERSGSVAQMLADAKATELMN